MAAKGAGSWSSKIQGWCLLMCCPAADAGRWCSARCSSTPVVCHAGGQAPGSPAPGATLWASLAGSSRPGLHAGGCGCHRPGLGPLCVPHTQVSLPGIAGANQAPCSRSQEGTLAWHTLDLPRSCLDSVGRDQVTAPQRNISCSLSTLSTALTWPATLHLCPDCLSGMALSLCIPPAGTWPLLPGRRMPDSAAPWAITSRC